MAFADADEWAGESGVEKKTKIIMELILEISKSFGSIILAIVAAYLASRHNKLSRELSNDNLQKQLFTEFNSRYDNMNDIIQFVLDFSKEDSVKFLESKNDEGFGDYNKAFIKFKINDYFNLCAEEYYWYSKKRIDDRIWNSWKKGMDDIYNKSEIIRKQWQEEIKNDGWKSFYLDKPTTLFD